jgi:hypothetical protein
MTTVVGIGIVSIVIQRIIAHKRPLGPASWGLVGMLIVYMLGRKRGYDPKTGMFRLKNFEMDTKTGQFTINGFHYDKSAVREVRWENYHNVVGREVGGKITVAVNDIQHPVHDLKFHTVFTDFDTECERMKMLLCG